MSSILTFSNRSVKLFTLKNHFLITAKALHSIRMCLTVQVVWKVKHCGCGSCFKMKEWVSLVWPIRNRDITTCSLLDFLDASLHSPKVGWIWKSLLWMLLLHWYIYSYVISYIYKERFDISDKAFVDLSSVSVDTVNSIWWLFFSCGIIRLSIPTKHTDSNIYIYIYIYIYLFVLVWLFYGISMIVGYLMPNPLYTYILSIYDLVL